MIGAMTDKPVEQRVYGSLAAALIAVQQGAQLIRVHDVAATVDALKVWAAAAPHIKKAEGKPAAATVVWPDED